MKTNKRNTQLIINFEENASEKTQNQTTVRKVSFYSFDEARRNAITQKILKNTKSF